MTKTLERSDKLCKVFFWPFDKTTLLFPGIAQLYEQSKVDYAFLSKSERNTKVEGLKAKESKLFSFGKHLSPLCNF